MAAMFRTDDYGYKTLNKANQGWNPQSVPVQAQQASAYGMDLGGAPTMGQLYQGVMGQLKGWGNAQQLGMKQEYENAMGKGMQSLASSGLAGTSVAPSMRMGYMQQYQNALNNLNQQLTQQRIGAETQIGTEATRQSMQYQQMNQQSQQQAQNLGLGYAGLNQQHMQGANQLAFSQDQLREQIKARQQQAQLAAMQMQAQVYMQGQQQQGAMNRQVQAQQAPVQAALDYQLTGNNAYLRR